MQEPPGEGHVFRVTGVGDISPPDLMYFVCGVLVVLHMAISYRFGEWDPR